MPELTLFGITNCDSVKKARRWLDEKSIAYHFHNFKTDGVPEDLLRQWIEQHGIEQVVNRRGTTWRKLQQEQKSEIESAGANARALIRENPSMIKRPILAINTATQLGFNPEQWLVALN